MDQEALTPEDYASVDRAESLRVSIEHEQVLADPMVEIWTQSRCR